MAGSIRSCRARGTLARVNSANCSAVRTGACRRRATICRAIRRLYRSSPSSKIKLAKCSSLNRSNNFQAGSPRQQLQRFPERDLSFLHHEGKAVTTRVADPAAKRLPVRVDVHRGVVVIMKRTETNKLPPPPEALQADVLADQRHQIRASTHLFTELVGEVSQVRLPVLSMTSVPGATPGTRLNRTAVPAGDSDLHTVQSAGPLESTSSIKCEASEFDTPRALTASEQKFQSEAEIGHFQFARNSTRGLPPVKDSAQIVWRSAIDASS